MERRTIVILRLGVSEDIVTASGLKNFVVIGLGRGGFFGRGVSTLTQLEWSRHSKQKRKLEESW
jgi:hypothetical protein